MLFPAEQAFVGRDEKRAPLKTPAWEASIDLKQRHFWRSELFVSHVIVNIATTTTITALAGISPRGRNPEKALK